MQDQNRLNAVGARRDDALKTLERRLASLRESFEDALARPLAEPRRAERKYLTFLLNQERFAWPVTRLAEVLRRQRIIPAPGAIATIPGVINYRNQTLSVTSLHDILGLPRPEPQPSNTLLITRGLNVDTALLIDGVRGVLAAADEDIRPKPVTLDRAAAAVIAGEIVSDGGMISILNPGAVSG